MSSNKPILHTKDDWRTWFGIIKRTAETNNIWDYVNPDVETPAVLQEPDLPEADDYLSRMRYKRVLNDYEKKQQSLIKLNSYILETVSKANAHYVYKCTS
jgi:hypothetical protein